MALELKRAWHLLAELAGGEMKAVQFLLEKTIFIDPRIVREVVQGLGTSVWFPKTRRRQFRDDDGVSNQKAQEAFIKLTGINFRGTGYHLAHVFGNAADAECFTAAWNLAIMPGFLKLFTEDQDRIEIAQRSVRQIAYDLYLVMILGFADLHASTTPEWISRSSSLDSRPL